MSVENYLKLDVSSRSEAATNLMARAEYEAQQSSIALLGDGDDGAASENLTPEMNSWFGEFVALKRQAALDEVAQRASKIKLDGVDGIVLDIEEDTLHRKYRREKDALYEQFRRAHSNQIDNKIKSRYDYSRKYGELNRDAVNYSPIAQWAPGVLSGAVEGIFNFSNLVEVMSTGFTALSVSLIIAVVIGFAVHTLGKGLAEYGYFVQAGGDDKTKNIAFVGGSIALMLGTLVTLFVLQYDKVKADEDKAILLGSEPPNIFIIITTIVAFNILIYAAGTFFTAKMYDPDPEYAKIAEERAVAEARIDKLKASELDQKLADIKKREQDELGRIAKKANGMDGKAGYNEVRAGMGHIKSKDSEVTALMGSYRSILQRLIEKRDPDFQFDKPVSEWIADVDRKGMSLAHFAAAKLYLYKALT